MNRGGIAVGRSERPNLKMFGSGNPSGGHYHKVKMMGDGDIFGDLTCDKLRLFGSNRVNGHVNTGKITVMGTSGIDGHVTADQATIFGEVDVDEDAWFKEGRLSGNVKIKGAFSGEKTSVRGNLSVGGNCEVEDFRAKGIFTIDGLLNAEHIDIRLNYADSAAGEIGGKTVKVRKGRLVFRTNPSMRLTAESIEGDWVDLEHTKAKVVRGKHVRIGPGCEIGFVEYQSDFRKDGDAEVKGNRKI